MVVISLQSTILLSERWLVLLTGFSWETQSSPADLHNQPPNQHLLSEKAFIYHKKRWNNKKGQNLGTMLTMLKFWIIVFQMYFYLFDFGYCLSNTILSGNSCLIVRTPLTRFATSSCSRTAIATSRSGELSFWFVVWKRFCIWDSW